MTPDIVAVMGTDKYWAECACSAFLDSNEDFEKAVRLLLKLPDHNYKQSKTPGPDHRQREALHVQQCAELTGARVLLKADAM